MLPAEHPMQPGAIVADNHSRSQMSVSVLPSSFAGRGPGEFFGNALRVLFNSLTFLYLFLPITYFVFWRLKHENQRYIWLTLTGYVFYGFWDSRFCALMAFSTLVSYLGRPRLLRLGRARRADGGCAWSSRSSIDLCCWGSSSTRTSVLDTVSRVGDVARRARFSVPSFSTSSCPIGISFYTFHTITYIVDGYRGSSSRRATSSSSRATSRCSRSWSRARSCASGRSRRTWRTSATPTGRDGWTRGVVVLRHRADQEGADRRHARRVRRPGAGSATRALSTLGRLAARCSATRSSSISISRATATWRSGSAISSGFASRRTSTRPTRPLDPSDFWRRWHISLSTLPAGLPVHPARRQSGRLDANLPQPHADDADRRAVARRQLDVRDLGRLPRHVVVRVQMTQPAIDNVPKVARQAMTFFLVVIGRRSFGRTNIQMAAQWLSADVLTGTRPRRESAWTAWPAPSSAHFRIICSCLSQYFGWHELESPPASGSRSFSLLRWPQSLPANNRRSSTIPVLEVAGMRFEDHPSLDCNCVLDLTWPLG